MKEKFIEYVFITGFVIAMVLSVWWLLWHLWIWVLPQVWPTGPAALIHPDYWLFAAWWFLLSLVGRAIFGRSK